MCRPSQLHELSDESGQHSLKSIPTGRDRALACREVTFDREDQIDRPVLEVPAAPVEAGASGAGPGAAHPSNALPPSGQGFVVS
jgi:hypothetical protein